MKIASLFIGTTILATTAFSADIDVYKTPECGCCSNWSKAMEKNGFSTKEYKTNDIMNIKHNAGVPDELSSCHTALVGGYAIEGHVPAAEIKKLLSQKPDDVIGISVPGMPIGSPGMEQDGIEETYKIIAFYKDGSQKVWATYKGSDEIK
ncbi:DUF411 domain-containing protein [Campylobacter fetus]|uniref:DUF411 domain-containing protein n=1 Tax=Campylobacter fetus TaxID=196 RepID=UPI00288C6D95|nr:DUF411 domain-containing protein [Campylobacter fetus subsp. venerealis]